MTLDGFLFFVYLIPLALLIIFDQENLKSKKVFVKYLLIAIVISIIGLSVNKILNHKDLFVSYLGSQMTLSFVLLHKVFSNLYFKIFKREPEFHLYSDKVSNIIYSFFVLIGIIALPVLVDKFIIHNYLN